MTHRSWRILAVFIAFIPGSPDHALACSCGMSGPPCQATWTADAVFSGIVQSVEMINHEDLGGPSQQRLVRFTIEQPFVNAGAGPIEIVTGMGGGDCGYAFTRGRRYLVYAWKRGTRMYTGI